MDHDYIASLIFIHVHNVSEIDVLWGARDVRTPIALAKRGCSRPVPRSVVDEHRPTKPARSIPAKCGVYSRHPE